MASVLFLGLLMGLRHAVESDHVAAVASLTAGNTGKSGALRLGALWGSGHALALFAVGLIFIGFDWGAPEAFSGWLELAVGVMLVVLGVDLVRRVVRERIHFHAHRHRDATQHFHAHSHLSSPTHTHNHARRQGQKLSLRAFLVGMVHGMAGSAALVVLVLGTIQSFWQGVAYMAIFGAGSIVGMSVLSLTISLPLRLSARSMTWTYNGLQGAIGVWTLVLGGAIVYERVLPLI